MPLEIRYSVVILGDHDLTRQTARAILAVAVCWLVCSPIGDVDILATAGNDRRVLDHAPDGFV